MRTHDSQPAWVAILVAIIMAVVGPLIVWHYTNNNVQSQKNETSALAQEVNSISNRVDQVNLTVQAISTTLPSEATPQQLIEPADIENLRNQISALEQQVAAITMRPTSTPLPGPLASSSDLDALRKQVLDLEKMIEQLPTPEPMTIATVLAQEGIPVNNKLQIVRARASSTDGQLNNEEKPIYQPEMVADSNDSTMWLASASDLEKAWIELDLDNIHTITGIRFLSYGRGPVFQDATLIFSNDTAQDLHLTQAQLYKVGWQYFPLAETQADRIRIVVRSLSRAGTSKVSFSEIEIYGK